MKSKLATYLNWLCNGDDPLFTCQDHGFVDEDNTKYAFYGVELRYPLYVSTQKNPEKGTELSGFEVNELYIKDHKGVVWAHLKVSFPDADSPLPYKTPVLIWRMHIGSYKALKLGHEMNIPGRMFFDWFAYFSSSVCNDLRYEEFKNVTILKDLPYLAGLHIVKTMHFSTVIRHRLSGIALFYNETRNLVGVSIIPKWNVETKRLKPLVEKNVVGIALGVVEELKTIILDSLSIQRAICDSLREDDETFFFLDTDAILNTNFAPSCQNCLKKLPGNCSCKAINKHIEKFSWINKLYVLVLEEYANLNGALCHTAVGLAALLLPEKISVYRLDSIFEPTDLLCETFEEVLQGYTPLPNSHIYSSWTSLAVLDEKNRLRIETVD